MQNALMAEISNLSVAERILLVEEIWDHIADTEDSAFTLSDSQCAELDHRITQYQNQPDAGRSWNDVKEEYFRGNR